MSYRNNWRRRAEVGAIATRLLTIPVMATALMLSYVALSSIRDEPGWIKFDIDGKFAYPSTGEVIDVKTRKIVANLTDEAGRAVQSEKMIDIKFDGPNPQIGDQFGRGRAVAR